MASTQDRQHSSCASGHGHCGSLLSVALGRGRAAADAGLNRGDLAGRTSSWLRRIFMARYYDPATAQFLTVDPAVSTTLSPYGYVQGDPLNATDASGLCFPFCIIGAVVGGVVGAVAAGVSDVVAGNTSNVWADVGRGAAIGAATGFAAGLCGPACAEGAGAIVSGALAGGVASAATNAVNQGFNSGWGNIDWGSVGRSGVWGALGGGLGSALLGGGPFGGLAIGMLAGLWDARMNQPHGFPETSYLWTLPPWGSGPC